MIFIFCKDKKKSTRLQDHKTKSRDVSMIPKIMYINIDESFVFLKIKPVCAEFAL